MRKLDKFLLLGAACVLGCLPLAACDNDDDGGETPTPAPGGVVWVADKGGQKIEIFDYDGTHRWTLSGQTGFWWQPFAVAIDRRDGSAWILDYYANCVRKYDGDWNLVYESPHDSGQEPLIRRATSIACDSRNGSLWIADRSHNRVLKLGSGGALKATVNGFSFPRNVSVDSGGGACWVADELNKRAIKLPANANGMASASEIALVEVRGFDQPWAAIADPNGGAWILDKGKGEVVVVDGSGAKKATITGLRFPVDAAILPSAGSVFVVDEDADCVYRFPRALTGTGTAEALATLTLRGFSTPTDIDADEDGGFIFVSDGDAVYRYTLAGERENKITEGLALPGAAGADPKRE